MKLRVVSGGQTGVDQAALQATRAAGLETGGWAAKGWMTLDGPKPELLKSFGLIEYPSPGYKARTRANVRDTECTIRIASRFGSPGERCTAAAIMEYGRPSLDVLWLPGTDTISSAMVPASATEIAAWLKWHNIRVLNVAGNSEQTSPGIGAAAQAFLAAVLEAWKEEEG